MNDLIQNILNELNNFSPSTREFFIGQKSKTRAIIIYINSLANTDLIDNFILSPLMMNIKEDLVTNANISDYLIQNCIAITDVTIETNIPKACMDLKIGKTLLILDGINEIIIINTCNKNKRDLKEPINESVIRGPRIGFIEDIGVNISLIKNKVKDKTLAIEIMKIGRRTQTDLAIVYMNDIVDKDILKDLRKRLELVDVDSVLSTGTLDQCIEGYPYSFFPQSYGTERIDIICENILEGRIAVILDGTPYVMSVPTTFSEFFEAAEDRYERTYLSSFVRIIRVLGTFIVISLPAIYLTLIKFNSELIPVKLLVPIMKTRRGIAFTPFMEILSMLFVVELLREGGLRLPSKIAQTLSVVGGFIIGTAAIEAKLVSQATVLIVGISTIGTFIIPNYEMALTIRLISLILLILSNIFGVIGFASGWYLLIVELMSLDSFGVPYFNLRNLNDVQNLFIRMPIWKVNKRTTSIPNNDNIKQTDYRKFFKRYKDE